MFTLKIIANIRRFKNKPLHISMSSESMPASGSSSSNPTRMLLKAARGAQSEHQVGLGENNPLKGRNCSL